MRLGYYFGAIGLTAALGVLAIQAQAQEGQLKIDLNKKQEVEGGCQVTFVAENRLGSTLDSAIFELTIFNKQDIVSDKLILDFKRLPKNGKRQTIDFVLPPKCETISQLVLNAKNCKGDTDMLKACEDGFQPSSHDKDIALN